MKFLGKKGQGAMEYLMTYGWAILVVMIVGIAMWRLGIFKPSGTQAVMMQGFGGVKPQLTGTGYSAEGKFTGVFLNAVGHRIQIKGIKVTDNDDNSMSCTDSSANCCPKSGSITGTWYVAPNKHFELSIDDDLAACTSSFTPGDPGDPYQLDVEVTYDVTIAGATSEHKSSGIIRGPLE